MIKKKTPEDFEKMRKAGAILGRILKDLGKMVAPGVSTQDIDDEAMRLMELYSAEPVLLGYHPEFAPRPYPAAICTSVNDVIVHGVPNEDPIVLQEGDIIGIDVSLAHEGMFVDSAWTVPVGVVDALSQKLIDITREARAMGIAAAHAGNTTGDIGHAIQSFVRPHGFGIVEELCGHGVGYAVHEEPFVPNFGKKGEGVRLEVGMALAIEPMLNAGKKQVIFDEGGYTVRTKDGSRSAHFEHTVLITEKGPEIVTSF